MRLKKDLIVATDEANSVKEKLKVMRDDLRARWLLMMENDEQFLAPREKLKTIAAKAIEAFQQTKEYNIMLHSWYFKGFELLRRYFIKHPSGVDLENLDLEEVDKEMGADEASQSTTLVGDAPESTPLPPLEDDLAVDA